MAEQNQNNVPEAFEQVSQQPPVVWTDPANDLLNNENAGDEQEAAAVRADLGIREADPEAVKKDVGAQVAALTETLQNQDRRDAKLDKIMEAMLAIVETLGKAEARREAVRQLSFNEVAPVSPWNPEGKRNRLGFTRPTFLHGIMLNSLCHTEKEIDLWNKIKPGRYIERQVEVQLGSGGEINLQWAGSKLDARITMYTRFPKIELLLQAVIDERAQKEEARRKGQYQQDEYL